MSSDVPVASHQQPSEAHGVTEAESIQAPDIGIQEVISSTQPLNLKTDHNESATSGRLNAIFDEGFTLQTEDKEFDLTVHSEVQLDVRAFGEHHPEPLDQFGFYVPRMRMIFNGHLTKPIEFGTSINKGLGNLDLLDAYLNFNYDKRLQFKIGRYRAPFTYDWYALSNQYLTTPERSVFAINYGLNRNFAATLHGELWDDRLEYAIAAANGPRNQYVDFNSSKDLLGYINLRPFDGLEGLEPFKNLNIGYSVDYGLQDQDPLPVAFRTSANATESAGTLVASPAFLELYDGVVEKGARQMHEVFLAYYFRQLTVQAAFDTGYNDYRSPTGTQVHLPTHGYHAQFGYFLTGEEVEKRTYVEPLHPFDLREGKHGPGAIELQARYDDFQVGREVFAEGLADADSYTNHVRTIDSGLNWYLNKYIKIYFDWQHSMYSNPVVFRQNGRHRSSDLYWTRFQMIF